MSLEDDENRCFALFCETDSDCFSLFDNDEHQCRTQKTEKEVLYSSSKVSFLIELLIKNRGSYLLWRHIHLNQLGKIEYMKLLEVKQISTWYYAQNISQKKNRSKAYAHHFLI